MNKPLLTILAATMLFGCNDDNETTAPSISNEESAELVASTLASEATSLFEDLGQVSIRSVEANNGRTEVSGIPCGETVSQDFSKDFENNSISFEYEATYSNTLTCMFSVPVSLSSEVDASSSVETARLSSSRTLSGNALLTIDTENLGNLLFNATLINSGQFAQKLNQQRSFTTTSSITLTDVSINVAFINELLAETLPSARLITSGTGIYIGTLSENNGEEQTFTASITFNPDGTVDITVNGESFTADLESGALL